MSNIVSLDHEVMLLPLIGGELCGHQTSLRKRVIIKVAFRFSDDGLLGDMSQDWNLSLHVRELISLGPLGSIASKRLQAYD